MHVDSVEVQFGEGGVVVACAGIDFEDFELQCPVGLRTVVVAERAHIESLERAAVLQGKCGNGLAPLFRRAASCTCPIPPNLTNMFCTTSSASSRFPSR